ncbi:MAG: hypothetical protein MUP44_07475 [Anaerolineales bacterium]|nr:hypothetical protein [Anaerolineales bacterium]
MDRLNVEGVGFTLADVPSYWCIYQIHHELCEILNASMAFINKTAEDTVWIRAAENFLKTPT